MKKLLTSMMIVMASFASLQTQAQAFSSDSKLLSFGIGPGEMIHLPTGNNNPFSSSSLYGTDYNGTRSILTGQLALQAEFAVHKYVGVGFVIGIGGRAEQNGVVGIYSGYTSLGYAKEVNVPIGVLANFHFFQLIADKTGKNIHADKLDVYAGLTVGSGVAIHPYSGDPNVGYNFYDALLFAGPHVGVNYYFAPNIGVNGEVGWGTTLLQAGLIFKVGGSAGGSSKKK